MAVTRFMTITTPAAPKRKGPFCVSASRSFVIKNERIKNRAARAKSTKRTLL